MHSRQKAYNDYDQIRKHVHTDLFPSLGMDLEENWSQIRDARIKHGMLDYVYHKRIYEDKYLNMRYEKQQSSWLQ